MEGYGESGSGKQARKCSEKVASVCQWALLLFGDQYIDSYLVWSLPPFIPFFFSFLSPQSWFVAFLLFHCWFLCRDCWLKMHYFSDP